MIATPHRIRRTKHRPKIHRQRNVDIARQSDELFRYCKNHDVTVFQDAENTSISVEKLGYEINQRRLGLLLQEQCEASDLHVFASGNHPHNVVGGPYPAPWKLHFNQAETVLKHGESVRRSNSDNLMIFTVGQVLALHRPEIIVLATGDGDLAIDLARFIKVIWGDEQRIVTLSVAGATSWRLDARQNRLFDANFEIGYDLFV